MRVLQQLNMPNFILVLWCSNKNPSLLFRWFRFDVSGFSTCPAQRRASSIIGGGYVLIFIFDISCSQTWAYGKEKIRGAERNLPDFFGLCRPVSVSVPF